VLPLRYANHGDITQPIETGRFPPISDLLLGWNSTVASVGSNPAVGRVNFKRSRLRRTVSINKNRRIVIPETLLPVRGSDRPQPVSRPRPRSGYRAVTEGPGGELEADLLGNPALNVH
jgi:hypothetical protein